MQATQTESSSSEQNTQPSLEERLDSLEQGMLLGSKITWKDQLNNFFKNFFHTHLYQDFPPWLTFAGTTILGAVSYSLFLSEIGEPHVLDGVRDAYTYLNEVLQSSNITQGVSQAQITPEVFDIVHHKMEVLAEHDSVPAQIEEFADLLHREKIFHEAQDEIMSQPIDYRTIVQDMRDHAKYLINESVDGSRILGLVSGVLGLFGGGISLANFTTGQFSINDYNKDKRKHRRKIKEKFAEFREECEDHPHAEAIFTYARDEFREHPTFAIRILRNTLIVAEHKDPAYAPIFTLLKDPKKREQVAQNLHMIIEEFDEARDRTAEQEKKVENAIQRAKQVLHLLDQGVDSQSASKYITFVENMGGDSKTYFTQKLYAPDLDPTLFRSVGLFYHFFNDIPEEKRLAMAKSLFKRGSRQYASALQQREIPVSYDLTPCCEVEEIMEYISRLDEIPGVGVKGQVETLILLNGAVESLQNWEGYYTRLAQIAQEARPELGKGATTVARFLARHPNIGAAETMSALIEYYRLAGEEGFSSKWIRKEEIKLGEHEPKESALNKRGERKFLEELERKIELVRYERFRDEIEDIYYSPLTHLLGESVTRSKDVAMSSELLNVIRAYSKEGNLDEHYKKRLKKIISIWAQDPNSSAQKISQLPGNQSLEERLGAKKLAAWREGHSKSYITSLDKDLEKRLQQEVQSEFEELLRCATELGYEMEENESLETAEQIYKTIANFEIEEEKRYLLEEAKHHLQKLKQGIGDIEKSAKHLLFYDSKDPIESLQMGIVTGSCTNIIRGANSFAAVVNTLDDNKKVIYMKNEKGERVGRTLATFTDQGIVTYRKYDKSSRKTDAAWVDYFHGYAKQVGTALIVPTHFVTPGLKVALRSRGAKTQTISPRLHKAVCDRWYDDRGVGRVGIPEKGYKKQFRAYVLK